MEVVKTFGKKFRGSSICHSNSLQTVLPQQQQQHHHHHHHRSIQLTFRPQVNTDLAMLPKTLRRSAMLPRPAASRYATATRHFQTSTVRAKDTEDRNNINTESREYSKSGGDGAAAQATADAAFSADKTRPEEQHDAASKQTGSVSICFEA